MALGMGYEIDTALKAQRKNLVPKTLIPSGRSYRLGTANLFELARLGLYLILYFHSYSSPGWKIYRKFLYLLKWLLQIVEIFFWFEQNLRFIVQLIKNNNKLIIDHNYKLFLDIVISGTLFLSDLAQFLQRVLTGHALITAVSSFVTLSEDFDTCLRFLKISTLQKNLTFIVLAIARSFDRFDFTFETALWNLAFGALGGILVFPSE